MTPECIGDALAGLTPERWARMNRRLVAKALSELAFEQAFDPVVLCRAGQHTACVVTLASGASYCYQGIETLWGQIMVDPDSVFRRRASGNPASRTALPGDAIDIQQFVLDARVELGADDPTTAGLLHELTRTLAVDCAMDIARENLSAIEALSLRGTALQARLSGHPKMLANKGRLGWNADDARRFAPEHEAPFQLVWIAVDRRTAVACRQDGLDEGDLLDQSLTPDQRDALRAASASRGVNLATHAPMPVHPWQWQNVIATHFAGEIAQGRIVRLGTFGDAYRAQLSIRTVANAQRPQCCDLKLSLSILNTSVFRGIRENWVRAGPTLSSWLETIARTDAVLGARRLVILREIGGFHYTHPAYRRLTDAPYRYHEHLGAIWRESVDSKLAANEEAVLLASFMERDASGHAWVNAMIASSGLTIEAWLARLFDVTTVSLYHLLCRYHFCPIAHGQNVVVILRDSVPVGMALKDFHGSLVQGDFPEQGGLGAEVMPYVPREPAEVVIHNLLTAHLLTSLRFVSNALAADGVPERFFYQTLAAALRRYMAAHPELSEQFARFDLFVPKFSRYCLNRVRLRTGYGDATRRPDKIFGSPVDNPLHIVGASAATRPAPDPGTVN